MTSIATGNRRALSANEGLSSRDQDRNASHPEDYGTHAYRSDAVPVLPNQRREPNHSWLRRSASLRLPWGGTREVISPNLLARVSPRDLRRVEVQGSLLDEVGYEGETSHKCIRNANLGLRSRVISGLEVFGKGFFWISLPITMASYLLINTVSSSHRSWLEVLTTYFPVFSVIVGIPALMWLTAALLVALFPKWCVKNGRGPEWELKRRTGLVTVWQYPRKLPFRKRGEPEVIQYPFYEFDAWVLGAADRFGPRFDIVLCHRYSKLTVYIGDGLLGWQRDSKPCYALWDFLQNYMDVSRPLPELPALEAYRHLDPVTAAHDRQTGRPARYWRDMDDETFKEKVAEMARQVRLMDTERRPNRMAEKVRYAV